MKTLILASAATLLITYPAMAGAEVYVTDDYGNTYYGETDGFSGDAYVTDDNGNTYYGEHDGEEVIIYDGPHGETMYGEVE